MLPLRKITICWKIRIQLKLNNKKHRNDVWRTDGPPCDRLFEISDHNFNAHAKFTIIEQANNKSLSESKICSLSENRENFWILKLQTLSPQGLNIPLNYPQDTSGSIW